MIFSDEHNQLELSNLDLKISHVAYKRVSASDQNTEKQLANTTTTFDKIFEDKVSGADTNRPALAEMLGYVREDDHIHVHSIDRLARNLGDLNTLIRTLNDRGITITFHKENLTFNGGNSSPMSELMLNLLGSVYQFERNMLLERQREGIAKAKKAGKYKGGVKRISDELILEELANGLSIRKVANKLNINPSTVQRAKKNQKQDTESITD